MESADNLDDWVLFSVPRKVTGLKKSLTAICFFESFSSTYLALSK